MKTRANTRAKEGKLCSHRVSEIMKHSRVFRQMLAMFRAAEIFLYC